MNGEKRNAYRILNIGGKARRKKTTRKTKPNARKLLSGCTIGSFSRRAQLRK
jgi:hypothetical protein